MRVCHGLTANFDDPNLVSCAGLAPVLGLAERAGLHRLVARHVRIGQPAGVKRGPQDRLAGRGDGRRRGFHR